MQAYIFMIFILDLQGYNEIIPSTFVRETALSHLMDGASD